ncbi:MAG: Na+/H+ antiporter subunit E [Dermatophilaceae bacterium]
MSPDLSLPHDATRADRLRVARRRWARRLRRRIRPWPVAFLTTMWVLLWSDVTVANILAGALIAATILVLFPLPRVSFGLRLHPWAFVVLLATFQFHLVVASLEVAYKSVAPWCRPAGRFITVQLRGPADLTRTLTAEFCSLVPGSLVVDLDRTTGIIMLHLFDAPDEASGRLGIRRVHEQEARVLRALSPRGETS